jgi:D-arabinose 1-dehydrogenase-like Zn-dependent alcohol dehydrogenase
MPAVCHIEILSEVLKTLFYSAHSICVPINRVGVCSTDIIIVKEFRGKVKGYLIVGIR